MKDNDLLRHRVDQLKVGLTWDGHCLKVGDWVEVKEGTADQPWVWARITGTDKAFRDADGRELITLQLQWITSSTPKPSVKEGQFCRDDDDIAWIGKHTTATEEAPQGVRRGNDSVGKGRGTTRQPRRVRGIRRQRRGATEEGENLVNRDERGMRENRIQQFLLSS